MAESLAGTWASFGGTEIINNARTYAYLKNGLGPSSLSIFGDCGCTNLFDLLDCFPDEVEIEQCVDLPGTSGNYLSTPDSPAVSLAGDTVLHLPGVAGNYASTPDSPANSITGDIDIRVKVAMDDWTPTGLNPYIVTKQGQDYELRLLAGGGLQVGWRDSGAVFRTANSSAPTGFVDGTAHWIRGTLDVDNGAGGRDVRFYTSEDGVTWAQLGTTVTQAGVTSIIDNVSALNISDGSGEFAGNVHYVEIRNGIDGPVAAKFDPSTISPTVDQVPTTLVSDTGETWTMNGTRWNWRRDNEVRSLRLSGASGVYASAPDTAALSITGDIDIRCKVALDDWTPASEMAVVTKWQSGSATRDYMLQLNPAGTLSLFWADDAVGGFEQRISTAAVAGVGAGTAKWIRVTLDVDNGAAGHTVTFYTSDDGGIWNQLGATVITAGVTSINDSSRNVAIGAHGQGNVGLLAGNVYYAEIRDGIDGTVVANPSFENQPWDVGETGGATGTDTAGNTWTLNGAAVIQRAFDADLDIRCKVAMDDWSPAANQEFVSKWINGSPGNMSFRFQMLNSPRLRAMISPDGVTVLQASATAATTFADGSVHWVRVTVDVDNGAAGTDFTFYTSDDGSGWVQLGTTVTIPGTSAIFDNTQPLTVGMQSNGVTDPLAGNVYYAEVRRGIDGVVVAKFDPDDTPAPGPQTPNTVVSETGETWTINGGGWEWCEQISSYPFYPYVSFPGYTSPAVDNAPWYSPDIPSSADFLGFLVEEFEGLDSPFTRDITQLAGNGAVLNRSRLGGREMTWRGYLFGATCCSVQYGLRWLAKVLARFDTDCQDCQGDDLEILFCCPDNPTLESPFRLLKSVGLLDGPVIESERRTCSAGCATGCGGSCIIEIEFTMAAAQPYFYEPAIPIYNCVPMADGADDYVPVSEILCPPFNCSDALFEAPGDCQIPSLPPTATYVNQCAETVELTFDRVNYLSVSRLEWGFLQEVVPVITISNNGPVTATGVHIGFYRSPDGNPCGDFLLNPPDCDLLCDELTIALLPGGSDFYIDGRTRKMSLICGDNNSVFAGERHTNGPWSWPVFSREGFCMQITFSSLTETSLCASLSLVPRTF